MEKDKISTCIKNWVDTQDRRLSNLNMFRVRAQTADGVYYGSLFINKLLVSIIPDDTAIRVLSVNDARLNDDIGPKKVKLNICGEPPVVIYFKSPKQQKAALKKMRTFIDDESTSPSDSEGS